MKHFTVILPIFVLLCLAPETRAANYYWGMDLGLSSLEVDGLRLKIENVPAYRPQSIDIKNSDNSTVLGAAFIYGVDFGWAGSIPLRLELEAFLSTGGPTINENAVYPTPQGPPIMATVKMKLNVDRLWSAGLNLWLDVPVGSFPVKPYLGGGFGYNHISYDADITINPESGALKASRSGSGNKFAYHYKLGGGLWAGEPFWISACATRKNRIGASTPRPLSWISPAARWTPGWACATISRLAPDYLAKSVYAKIQAGYT